MNLCRVLLLHSETTLDYAAMNSFRNQLTRAQEQKLQALDSWHRALENRSLRMECPDAYHEELLRQADEMDRQGIIDWEEWRDLRAEGDEAYLRAVAGADYHGPTAGASGRTT